MSHYPGLNVCLHPVFEESHLLCSSHHGVPGTGQLLACRPVSHAPNALLVSAACWTSCCVVHPRQLLHVNSSIVDYRYCNHADLSPRHASLLLGRVAFTFVSFSWVSCAPAACRCCTTAVTRRVAALLAERVTRCAAGMTNTAGAIPGIIGVVTTGAILDQTGSWPLALFVPSIFFFVTGAGC